MSNSQSSMRQLLEAVPDAIVVTDRRGSITFANPLAVSMFGYGIDELVGASIEMLLPERFRRRHAALRTDYNQSPHPRLTSEGLDLHGQRKDRSEFSADVRLNPIEGPDGPVVVCVIRDLTERRRAEHELGVARDDALAAASARSAFLANMSHEIRTPASAIIGSSRMLMDTPLNAEQRELSEAIWNSARSLLDVINEILDFSKASSGKLQLEETGLSPGAVLEGVMQLMAERVSGTAVELTSYVDGEVPVKLRGDPVRLKQVLINLVSNAAKFTERGEIAVSLRKQASADDEVALQFMVKDSGIGIPREIRHQLFEAFYQGDPSTTRRYGGTGLGLTIAAQLVELMGGKVGVESVVGQGSTFWFNVRMGRDVGSSATEAEARKPLAGKRILVADPSAIGANAVRAQLVAWGVDCDGVISVADAVAFIRRASGEGRSYHALLLSPRLGESDGFGWNELIREQPSLTQQPVILMCDLGHTPNESEMRAAGVHGWLAKPVRQSQLCERLLTAVGAAPASREEPQGRGPIESPIPEEVRRDTRLLVVEDHAVSRMVALKMLGRLGFHADSALNGREAIEAASRTPYDIILMDCQLPEVDGYEATRRIRRTSAGSHRPVIIGLTAHALQGDRRKCLDAGMDDYLAKPVLPEQLNGMLARWLLGTHARAARDVDGGASDGAAVDPAALAGLLAGEEDDGSYLNEVIGVFLADLAERMSSIRAAADRGDCSALAGNAHALKGGCGHFGARPMMALCGEIEKRARGGNVDGIAAVVDGLEREAVRVRDALEARRTAAAHSGAADAKGVAGR